VLEAAAPAPGPLAPFTRAWIRHAIPLFGRLSPDPTAYRYLSDSIFEFGSGPEFEADLAAAGFRLVSARSFLLGASRLWVAERGPVVGQKATEPGASVQGALPISGGIAQADPHRESLAGETTVWRLARATTSLALTLALGWALVVWVKVNDSLPLSPPQRAAGWVLLVGGLAVFGARSLVQWLAWSAVRGGGDRPR